jgi:hypothetical protein
MTNEEKLSDDILDKIVVEINSVRGRNIGTGLQDDLESSINAILPEGFKYYFEFNMGGDTRHCIYHGDNLIYNF